MRILVVSNLYPPAVVGGYEARCAHTVQWLARRHELRVLTSTRGSSGGGEGNAGTLIGKAPPGEGATHETGASGGARAPGEVTVQRELPFLTHDWRGSLRAPLASLRAARIMRRTLRAYDPELVFVWNASQIPRAIVRIAQASGRAVAISAADPWLQSFADGDQFLRHLLPGDRGLRRLWALLVRLLNRLPALRVEVSEPRAAAIAWNSEALRALVAMPACVTPVLERVIHPASANEELFAAVARAPAAEPTIVFVGRLSWEKAPDVAYRALALLRERHGVDARLVMVGSGEGAARRELDELARELQIERRVEVLGALAPARVAEILAGAHALLVPSRWQEPFGLVCLEGALARVPLVASRSGGMPEMLEAEREALFFAIDDAEGCAAALARTLAEPERTAARVDAAHRRAREDYSLARYRAAYDAFVEDAVRAFTAQLTRRPRR